MRTLLLKLLYLVTITFLFTLGFYRNQWQIVDMEEVQYRREVSEIYVMGRLVKSQQDGVFSAGGLLGIGDVSDSSVESRVIKNQYDKYNGGKGFSQYWAYKSHPGLQGILYSIFDSITDFSPMRNLAIFRFGVSLLLAISLAIFCFWVGDEISWPASIFVVFFTMFSTWLPILGGNMYWSLWSFYLPLALFPYLIKKAENNPGHFYSRVLVAAFVLSLVKILFSGFEFITASLFMCAVPLVYYAVLNHWGWKLFLRRMLNLGMSLAGSVVAGLVILCIQIRTISSSYKEVLNYLFFAWSKRTYGYEELLGDPSSPSKSFMVKILEVLGTYIDGNAFALSSHFRINSPFIRSFMDGKYLFLIFLFAFATCVFLIGHSRSKETTIYQTGRALITASWFSIVGPLSWLIVFRDHAALHTRLDFIVWQMPFTLYGFALIGFVITHLRFRHQIEKARS